MAKKKFGSLDVGLIFQDEDNKWNKCLVMIAIYIMIIGMVIAIIQY